MGTSAHTLAERAMLVSLRMSCWLPPRVDKAMTREMATRHGVDASLVKATKYLINPATPSYKALRRALGDVRTRYYWHTLPWAHYGARILPAVSFAPYSDDMRKLTARFTESADAFAAEFPALKVRAIATMAGLVTETDFPENIRDRFGVDLQVMPIPTVGDFRVAMSDESAARLKAEMQAGVDAQVRDALTLATRAPYERLYKHIARMVARLSDPKASFHDSLVTGLRDLCQLLPALNISGDSQLEEMRQLAERMVAGVDPAHLRDVPLIRERVCGDAKALQDLLAPIVTVNALPATAADERIAESARIESEMASMFGYNI